MCSIYKQIELRMYSKMELTLYGPIFFFEPNGVSNEEVEGALRKTTSHLFIFFLRDYFQENFISKTDFTRCIKPWLLLLSECFATVIAVLYFPS